MKRKILLLICLILFIVSIAGVSAVDDLNQTVDEDTLSVSFNEDSIVSLDDKDTIDLQKMIDDAENGSSITLEKDYKLNFIASSGGLHVNKVLTIEGNGHVIDALGLSRIFYVGSDSITLKNIAFKHGSAEEEGGAIYSIGDINLFGCSLIDCHAEYGGAVYSLGNVNLVDCTITNCHGSGSGAVYADSVNAVRTSFLNCISHDMGAGIFSGGDVTLVDCKFENCKNEESVGGAVYSVKGNVSAIGSTFLNCFSEFWGAAIFGEKNIDVVNCTFLANTGEGFGHYIGGGAIYSSGNLTVLTSNFTDNYAQGGGAIYAGGYFSIDGCNFIGNSADTSIGGAIFIEGEGSVVDCSFSQNGGCAIHSSGNLTVLTSNFTDNYGPYGGAIHSTGNITVLNSNFIGSSADENGGAVYSSGEGSFTQCNFMGSSSYEGGGAIYSTGNLSVLDSNFTGNSISYEGGGAIYSTSNLYVSNSRFVGNSANIYRGRGGAIYADGKGSLVDCTFQDCSAKDGGGAIYFGEHANISIVNGLFDNNSPNDFNSGNVTTNNVTVSSHMDVNLNKTIIYKFDGIQIDIKFNEEVTGNISIIINGVEELFSPAYGSISFSKYNLEPGKYDLIVKYSGNDVFSPCIKTAAFEVAAASFKDLQKSINNVHRSEFDLDKNYTYVDYVDDNSPIFIRKNFKIYGNGYTIDAANANALFYIENANVEFHDINFKNGINYKEFGAISLNNSNLIISNSNFVNFEGQNGGAIYALSGLLYATDSNFTDCTVSGSGGAIYGADIVVRDCNFIDCSAKDKGGAIYSTACSNVFDSNFTNTFSYGGGAVYSSQFLNVINSNFENIRTLEKWWDGYDGGAVYAATNGTVKGSTFRECSATGRGGAVYAEGCLDVSDSIFIDNSANGGGAIYSYQSLNVANSDFVHDRTCGDWFAHNFCGGAINCEGNVTVVSSRFMDCFANDGSGGAVFAAGNLNVSDSNFTHNSAYEGGSLYSDANVSASGSSFINCSGAAMCAYGNIGIVDCSFANNAFIKNYWSGDEGTIRGTGISIINSTFSSSSISFNSINFTVVNSTFVDSPISCDSSNFTVDSCVFTDASGNAPISSSSSTLKISNSIFEDNYGRDAGAIYSKGNLTVVNSNFTHNSAHDGGYWDDYPGIIYSNGNLTVVNSSFVNNFVNVEYGYIAAVFAVSNLSIINSSFINNTNCNQDNLIYINPYARMPYVDCRFIPVIFIPDKSFGDLTVKNSTFGGEYPTYSGLIHMYRNYLIFESNQYSDESYATLEINDKLFNQTLSSGSTSFNLSGYAPDLYDVIIMYSGDDSYDGLEMNISLLIGFVKIKITVPDVTMDYGDYKSLKITLTEDGVPIEDAKVNINIGGKNYIRYTDYMGRAYLSLNLDAGVYNAVVSYEGVFANATVTVNPLATETKLSYSKDGYDSVTLNAEIDSYQASGEVVFIVNGNNYTSKVEYGQATYTLNDMDVGNYTVQAFYKGNKNYINSTSNSVSFEIEQSSYALDVDDVTMDYGDYEYLTVTLTDDGSPVAYEDIDIEIDGETYTRTTDEDGVASMFIYLDAGVYTAFVSYQDVSANATVTVNPSATEITLSYTKESSDSVILSVMISPSLDDGDLIFTVNGEDYYSEICDGEATYDLWGLDVGNYTVQAFYGGDNNHLNSTSNKIIFEIGESSIVLDVEDVEMDYGDYGYLTVTLTEDGYPIADADIYIEIDGVIYTRTTDDDGESSILLDLDAGVYDAYVTYEDYSTTAIVTVNPLSTNTTLAFVENRNNVTLTAAVTPSDAYGEIIFTVNGEKYYIDFIGGKAILNLTDLAVGDYTVVAEYCCEDDNYESSMSNEVSFNVEKAKNNLTLKASTTPIAVGQVAIIVVEGFENATGNASARVGNGIYFASIDGGIAVFRISGLIANDTALISYPGDDKYNNASTSVDIIVNPAPVIPKDNLTLVASTAPITVGQVAIVVVEGFENATGNASARVGNGVYFAPINGGSAVFRIQDLVENTTALISYPGDDKYNNAFTTVDIVVIPKENLTLVASTTPITVGQVAIVVVEGFENATGNASARVGNGIYFASIDDGIAVFRISDLIANDTALISYPGDDNYNEASTSIDIIVNPVDTNITLSFAVNGNNVTLTADVRPSDLTGEVIFNVNGENYTAQIANSKAIYTLANLEAESYVANAFYAGNATYKSCQSNEVSFNISDDYFVITAPDLEKYYHGPERFAVTLTDSKGNPVTNASVSININGNDYTRVTDDKGVASMAINLNSGVYDVTTKYNASEVKSTVTIKATVSGENITKMFRNGTQYYATFYDTKGNTLANNTAVEFNINGVFYTRYTNEKGVARMNINLNPGEYVITAKNPNSTE
ncbi:Ig-like domain-containing protein, partial [Methanobrevibacter millerae]